MPNERQPLQNIAWLVGERLGRAAITATVLAVVARHLGPADFGRLNFAIAVTVIAAALANLGLEGVVVSELVRRPAATGAILGTALRLRFTAGLLTAAVVGLGAHWVVPGDAGLVAIVALGLGFQPADVIDLWFQRHLDSRRTVLARTVGIAAGGTLKLWLAAANAGLAAFAWAQVADTAFIALALAWAGWRSPHASGRWVWDAAMARLLWRRGAMLAVSSLAVTLAMRLDQLLVRHWLDEQATGAYFAAARLVDVVLFAGTSVALSCFPALAAAQAGDAGVYRDRLQGLFDALSALGWIAALGCTALGWLVTRVLYGPAYAAAVPILLIQGWAALVALNATARWQYIILSAPAVTNLGAAALHVVAVAGVGAALVPRLGAPGAAVALLAANLVSGVLTTALFPPLRPCLGCQLRGFLIPFTPARWPALVRQLHA